MIRIHTEVFTVKAIPESALYLSKPEEYPDIRLKIREAIHANGDLDIYIAHRACDNWFCDLEDYSCVSLINEHPGEQLKRKLGIIGLPHELKERPELILELGLLDLPVPSGSVGDVWSWVLESKLGIVWAEHTASFEHLGRIMQWYLDTSTLQPEASNLGNPFLRDIVSTIIQSWTEDANGIVKSAYQSVFKNPTKSALFLACWQNFHSDYPQLLSEWLEHKGLNSLHIEWISEKLPTLKIPNSLVMDLDKRIEAYWNGKIKQGMSWHNALSEMTGKVMGEFNAIKLAIEAEPLTCNSLDIEQLRLRFKDLSGAQETIGRLEEQLPPSEPSPPDASWSIEEWIQWAVKQYIPFKKWLIDKRQYSESADKVSQIYEDWLYKNYPELLRKPQHLVYGTFKQVKKIIDEGKRILWVFIDNCPVFWMPNVLKCFTRNGLILTEEPRYMLAMLPSVTSISRKSALAGRLPSQFSPSEDEKEAFIKGWRDRGVDAVKVIDHVDKLADAVSEPARIHLLVFNQLDKLAHASDHDLVNRQIELENILEYLAGRVAEAVKTLNEIPTGEVCVFVSTDHGSTRFSRDASPLAIPPSAQLDDESISHKRFVHTSSFSSFNQYDWFVLRADSFGLPKDYVVARGEGYIDKCPSGYTHGGLAPEETVVPVLVFQSGMISEEMSPSFTYASEPILRGRSQVFKVAIYNPYSSAISDLELNFPNFGVNTKLPLIPARTRANSDELEIYIPNKYPVENGLAKVDITYSYIVDGIEKTQIGILALKVRELYRTDLDDFGDMFNE